MMRLQHELIRLHEILVKYFDVEELRTLCFHLGIDYDDLKGEGKRGKARELVVFLEHHSFMGELIATGKRFRPDIAWDSDDAAIPPPSSTLKKSVNRNTIFISYSHSDHRWLERLHVHLKPLERDNTIVRWDDTMIRPDTKWREEIDKALKIAKVAILLVSADFLASDFITTNELPPLLKAAEGQGAIILPVIVSPCRFLQTPGLAQFQAVNPPSQPLVGLRRNNRELVFVKITEVVEDILKYSAQSMSLFTSEAPVSISRSHTDIKESSQNITDWDMIEFTPDELTNEALRVDTRPLMGKDSGKVLEFSYKKNGNFLYMLNEIWSLIADKVSPWKYGLQWAIQDRISGKVFFEERFKDLSDEHFNSKFVAYLNTLTW